MRCSELREFLAEVGDAEAGKALASFSVERNTDVEGFIRSNALAYEKDNNARTYLILNESMDILGYFTLSLSVVDVPDGLSNTFKKKMRGFGRTSAEVVPCYLIGQLARDDRTPREELPLAVFIEYAVDYAMRARTYVGGRFMLVDCIDSLVSLYKEHGFKQINKKGDLNQLILLF